MTNTPGPWLVNDSNETVAEIEIIADVISVDDSLNIATVYGGLPDDQQKANAFLIAAAPDLLHALKLVDEKWNDKEPYISHLIQATIAKAEGQRNK